MPVMEENKFETAKVALKKKFEFEPIEKKINELGWDKDNNIIITYYQNVIGYLENTKQVCGFMDWFDKEKNDIDVRNFNVSNVSSLLKQFYVWFFVKSVNNTQKLKLWMKNRIQQMICTMTQRMKMNQRPVFM